MARPKIVVQHFLVCRAVAWDGPAGPHTPRTLEGVSYVFGVPPGTEFPFESEELWLFARLFNENDVAGDRRLFVDMIWMDSPGGARTLLTHDLGRIPFRPGRPVVDHAWSLRQLAFPGPGQYELRLWHRVRWRWAATRTARVVAREYFRIEYQP
jgi:hypothetical protein